MINKEAWISKKWGFIRIWMFNWYLNNENNTGTNMIDSIPGHTRQKKVKERGCQRVDPAHTFVLSQKRADNAWIHVVVGGVHAASARHVRKNSGFR